ncbi:phage Gp37/Gp68 family protein [Aminobacter sp. SR38]|jgi:protein gp37|uniref:DUF5131 family protein n=1 Tax=Aminobacter sp. SR38 TaxID=2774562 RepID=UPI00177D280E|nr:phage Gp37/Gp68 family protein [Aminobacter sp. SR38]QOF71437.1 phage Gp37/Gp68 family protein [Aminobacter sp. SR38]
MADHSLIEWTDATWNPITGCSVVSPGCTNCYAMKLAGTRLKHIPSRAGLTRDSKAGPVWTGEVRLNEQWLDQPLRWKAPRRIFVCAHGDLFAENVPDHWIDRVFAVMALAPQHTFQVLTKRSRRMRDYVNGFTCDGARRFSIANAAGRMMADGDNAHDWVANAAWPLSNIWLGTSVEDQQRADLRIPDLLATPAAVHFASAEPLLGRIDFRRILVEHPVYAGVSAYQDALVGQLFDLGTSPIGDTNKLDWIIVGGESGRGARPMHPEWVRSLHDQCDAAGTAFFFKQWGEWAPICFMSEDQTDACYDPAPARYPEAIRRCKVDKCVLHTDGERFELDAWSRQARHDSRRMFEAGLNGMTMYSIGKKAAGRLLYGVEHNAMPEMRP